MSPARSKYPRAGFCRGDAADPAARLLSCARCDGGGCDACGRRGAFEQEAAGIAREVAVVLPLLTLERCSAVRLRLPALGARAEQPELPAGHLLLTVVPHPPEPGWSPPATLRCWPYSGGGARCAT
jgi:hypothetical protein